MPITASAWTDDPPLDIGDHIHLYLPEGLTCRRVRSLTPAARTVDLMDRRGRMTIMSYGLAAILREPSR